ncbi:DUF1327 domain-containing protein [Providencia stuartii]|nr:MULTISPECIES: DUF1327 domain-containing protein [Providencia]MBQ0456185.1 DUF1327 domain-containing protein [Providencia stuartii]MDN7223896.1 DUF1327 domain-containing protein [Providencia stuartii]QPN42303.1 DUF1327 domain-containing protein [Providencia sp. 2.29]WAZ76985.1 DUF1327 domain-containing protein [Providencia stuartii]WAZ81865.1 DUF1327 domain-containing protein [Providencia stuartii]
MSKKYEYSANDFTHTDSAISVQVCVAPSNFDLLPIFTLSVRVEKKDGEDINYYRAEAIKKAKEVIADIAEDAAQGDLHQNKAEFSGVIVTNGNLSLEERVTALELASHQQGEVISTLSDRMGKSPEGGDDVIFVDKLTAPPMKLRS